MMTKYDDDLIEMGAKTFLINQAGINCDNTATETHDQIQFCDNDTGKVEKMVIWN